MKIELKSGSEQNIISADKLFKGLTDKKFRASRHCIGILFLLLLCVGGKKWGEFSSVFDHLDWIFGLFLTVTLFYINMYELTPRFIYRGKAFMYLASLTALISFAAFIVVCFHYFILEPNRIRPTAVKFEWFAATIVIGFVFGPFLLLSSALKLLQRWINDLQTMNELEQRAVESELAALRNQIHPHFLFNMLNNINVLTLTQPEKASGIIIKLSSFLRHLIYETDRSDQVYLSSEIKFIEDYLDLEKIRRDDFTYQVIYNDKEVRGIKLPANIIVILVENAIKHSADSSAESFVNINVKVTKSHFYFACVNSVPKIIKNKRNNSGGAGLANIKRRLQLLYSDEQYELRSGLEHMQYTAYLRLPA